MTESNKSSVIYVLLWVVGLAVVADIVIVVFRQREVPEAQTPPAPKATVVANPRPEAPQPLITGTTQSTLETNTTSNELQPGMDLSTSEGMELFRKKQMAELRKQAKGYIGDPTHYHASEEEIRIMESNKAIVW